MCHSFNALQWSRVISKMFIFSSLLVVSILILLFQSHFVAIQKSMDFTFMPGGRKQWKDQSQISKDLLKYFPPQCPTGELCIGFGTPFFGDWKTWPRYTNSWQNICPKEINCTLVSDRSQAHAVIFHARDLSRARSRFRNVEQHWIYFSWEASVNVQKIGYNIFGDSFWRTQFNLTATYDRDSDIVTPYAWLEPLSKQEIDEINKKPLYEAGKKKKMAYAAISNCNTFSKREQYLQELAKYMDVDIYGGCGKKKLSPGHTFIGSLANEYRFYLSFENSYCKDYITEKFWWNGMKYPIIPVVMGGESRLDYERVAPRDSFIHVNDFQSASALANHLKLLSANETLYAKHLEWKRQWKLSSVDKAQHLICKVCEYLHSDKASRKQTLDIARVWNPKTKCFDKHA